MRMKPSRALLSASEPVPFAAITTPSCASQIEVPCPGSTSIVLLDGSSSRSIKGQNIKSWNWSIQDVKANKEVLKASGKQADITLPVGNYTVKLTVVDDKGSTGATSQPFRITHSLINGQVPAACQPPPPPPPKDPTAVIASPADSVPAGTVQLDGKGSMGGKGSEIKQWLWVVVDQVDQGVVASLVGQNTTVTLTEGGYSAQLTVIDATGAMARTTKLFAVTSGPQAASPVALASPPPPAPTAASPPPSPAPAAASLSSPPATPAVSPQAGQTPLPTPPTGAGSPPPAAGQDVPAAAATAASSQPVAGADAATPPAPTPSEGNTATAAASSAAAVPPPSQPPAVPQAGGSPPAASSSSGSGSSSDDSGFIVAAWAAPGDEEEASAAPAGAAAGVAAVGPASGVWPPPPPSSSGVPHQLMGAGMQASGQASQQRVPIPQQMLRRSQTEAHEPIIIDINAPITPAPPTLMRR